MTRPFKHPRTGIYWLRRRVPKDLVSLVGRREVTKSLETRDPAEAKLRLVQALAELDSRWSALKQGPRQITEREAHAYAITIYDSWLAEHRDNPSYQEFWFTNLHSRLWKDAYMDGTNHAQVFASNNHSDWNLEAISDDLWLKKMLAYCYEQGDVILTRYGFAKDASSRWKMAKAVSEAMQRASLILDDEARGIYGVANNATRSETSSGPGIERPSKRSISTTVSLQGLVEAWWSEAKSTGRKPSTFESYSNTFANFGRFLKHDDAERVTSDDVIRFKDHRLQTPSPKTGRVASAKTVKGTDLSALKTIFGWAVTNRRLASNPASAVTMKVGKQVRMRSKGFSDVEANLILAGALAHHSDRETRQTAAGKKWIPWLCALTGARVGEMAQLRRQDVYEKEGHWVVRITPEAGTVKNNEFREVVLHGQLVALGFPAFAQAAAEGPLFLRLPKGADVLKRLQGLKNRLAEFSRAIVDDRNVAPMHGFRHRFKTVGRDVGIDGRVLDAIQGHGARTVADAYGDVTVAAIAAAIAKIPDMEAGPQRDKRENLGAN